MIAKLKNANKGAVALILVIMITALTVVSAVVISLTNVSDLMSAYHFSEAEEAEVDLDSCLEDAMFRLASSTYASGTYYLTGVGNNCYYQIASSISGGLKTVTSTASSTSDVGYWEDTVVVQVNVSSTPISIYSYNNSNISFSSFEYCGDGACNASETCSDCSADCGSCQTCGNGIIEGTEACDDGNTNTEACGDGTVQSGNYCNSTCTGTLSLSEACDYTGGLCGLVTYTSGVVGCTARNPYCTNSCSACTSLCL